MGPDTFLKTKLISKIFSIYSVNKNQDYTKHYFVNIINFLFKYDTLLLRNILNTVIGKDSSYETK